MEDGVFEELSSCSVLEMRFRYADPEDMEPVGQLPILEFVRGCVVAERKPVQAAGIGRPRVNKLLSHTDKTVGLALPVTSTPNRDDP